MAACNSFLAPSLNNCSRNGFGSSFARSSSETTLFSGTGASFLFWRPRVRRPCFFFFIERMRLSLSPHPQLSVIAPLGAVGPDRPQLHTAPPPITLAFCQGELPAR